MTVKEWCDSWLSLNDEVDDYLEKGDKLAEAFASVYEAYEDDDESLELCVNMETIVWLWNNLKNTTFDSYTDFDADDWCPVLQVIYKYCQEILNGANR